VPRSGTVAHLLSFHPWVDSVSQKIEPMTSRKKIDVHAVTVQFDEFADDHWWEHRRFDSCEHRYGSSLIYHDVTAFYAYNAHTRVWAYTVGR
jgi:hypothetical protein